MKIDLREPVRVISASNVKGSDIRKTLDAVAEHRLELLARWRQIHGRNN
jgi:hypothetical protein